MTTLTTIFRQPVLQFFQQNSWLTATIFALATVIFLTTCKKIDVPKDTPRCIKQKIRDLLKEDCPSVQTVYQYAFQGKTIYLFSPKQCGADLTSAVVDDNCSDICSLGGISGNMVCNGDTFYKTATNEKLIWENK